MGEIVQKIADFIYWFIDILKGMVASLKGEEPAAADDTNEG